MHIGSKKGLEDNPPFGDSLLAKEKARPR